MKIYWHSTAPWGSSSYSVLTKRAVPEIVRQGHEACIGTWYGLQGEPQKWPIRKRGHIALPNGKKAEPVGVVTILPSVNGASYGIDTLLANYEIYQANVCITCMDVWVLPATITGRVKFAPWLPVDHDPVPQGIVDALAPAIYPMSFSRWGVEKLQASGIEAHYVPGSADTNVFKPGDKALAKKALGLPDTCKYLVTMVAANKDPSDRKGFGEALQAFAEFSKRHEDAYLYLHTDWHGPVKIETLCDRLGLSKKIAQPNALAYVMGMYDDEYMANVYRASDVLLNPAKSEGFGLPLIEAQMCGTPIAATDFSTTDELLFAGWKIKGQRHWSIGADSWRLLASVDSIVDVLEESYGERGNELLARQARNGALDYDTDTVAQKYWRPALQEIESLVSCKGGDLKLVTF